GTAGGTTAVPAPSTRAGAAAAFGLSSGVFSWTAAAAGSEDSAPAGAFGLFDSSTCCRSRFLVSSCDGPFASGAAGAGGGVLSFGRATAGAGAGMGASAAGGGGGAGGGAGAGATAFSTGGGRWSLTSGAGGGTAGAAGGVALPGGSGAGGATGFGLL